MSACLCVHMFTCPHTSAGDIQMKTIAIISQKGGAGKTTLALHLATAAMEAGLETAILDLDPQASATSWYDIRENESPLVLPTHAPRLDNELARVKEHGGDLAIIDTAPHSNSMATAAAEAADLILIPCRPAFLDLKAVADTVKITRLVKAPAVIVLSAVSAQGYADADEAAEVARNPELGISVCPHRLAQRVAFSRSLTAGLTAIEYEPEGKAADETRRLFNWICQHVDMSTTPQVKENGEETKSRKRA